MTLDNLLAGALGSLGGSLIGALIGGIVTYNVMKRHDKCKIMMDLSIKIADELIDVLYEMKKDLTKIDILLSRKLNNMLYNYKIYEPSTIEQVIDEVNQLWGKLDVSYFEVCELFQKRRHVLKRFDERKEVIDNYYKSISNLEKEFYSYINRLFYEKMINDINFNSDDKCKIEKSMLDFQQSISEYQKLLQEFILFIQDECYYELYEYK